MSELTTDDRNFRQELLLSEKLRTSSQTFVVGNSDSKCPMEHTHYRIFRQQACIEHLLSEILTANVRWSVHGRIFRQQAHIEHLLPECSIMCTWH